MLSLAFPFSYGITYSQTAEDVPGQGSIRAVCTIGDWQHWHISANMVPSAPQTVLGPAPQPAMEKPLGFVEMQLPRKQRRP